MPACRKKSVALSSLTLAFLLLGLPGAASASPVALTGDVSIVLSEHEPVAVRHAVEDLAGDFEKVFRQRPKIVNTLAEAGPMRIVIGHRSGAPESFAMTGRAGGGHETIALDGADMRGTIYAIYQFSQDYLGVDPMYYWTDHEPLKRSRIVLPASFTRVFKPPVFRYRGIFLNDEDMLSGWAPGNKDGSGISLDVLNHIYETLLRLKANMVVPGSWMFPGEPAQRLVGERGLVLSIHHATPLDVNVARWPKDVPYNYTTHPQILENAWRNAVAAFPKDQEILWEVGLRGLSDEGYDRLDPAAGASEQQAGAIVTRAIAKQIEIVRQQHPKATFVSNLWQEGASLMRKGYLTYPKDVITVWADDGWGYLQDGGQIGRGQGAYYHVAMYQGQSNQLSEVVPVQRIYSELGRIEKAGATQFLLVNTSDIRPVTMTTRATMDFGWSGAASMGTSDDYYKRWAQDEFGAAVAPDLVKLFKDYFAAPAMADDINGRVAKQAKGWEYADLRYHNQAREYLLTAILKHPLFLLPSQAPLWRPAPTMSYRALPEKEWVAQNLPIDIARTQDATQRWDRVWQEAQALTPRIDPGRRDFYQASVLTMIAINRESNAMLLSVARARQALDAEDKITALARLEEARGALARIKQQESAAEYGKWSFWFSGDWLTGIDRTIELVDTTIHWVKDSHAPIPIGVISNGWEAYEHINAYQGDRTVDVSDGPK